MDAIRPPSQIVSPSVSAASLLREPRSPQALASNVSAASLLRREPRSPQAASSSASAASLLSGEPRWIGETFQGGLVTCLGAPAEVPHSCRIVLLYFTGRWCPLCEEFDHAVQAIYSGIQVLPEGRRLQLVLVPLDTCASAHAAHLERFGGRIAGAEPLGVRWAPGLSDELAQARGVVGLPTLLVLDAETGETLSGRGREAVAEAHVQLGVVQGEAVDMRARLFQGVLDAWLALTVRKDGHGRHKLATAAAVAASATGWQRPLMRP